ncbi:tetratricopeptide repeat protein [bacterium]|nr:tetratricopeptide repeat protein [bacterium]
MGVVYRAHHLETGQHVALKTIVLPREGLMNRIRSEIRALARIDHPGIVRIVDQGCHEGIPWYAMELIQGSSLVDYVNRDHDRGNPAECQSISGAQPAGDNVTASMITARAAVTQSWWTRSLTSADNAEQHTMEELPQSTMLSESVIGPGYQPPRNDLHQIIGMIIKICYPLMYLHGEGIVHRDLKPDNILVDQGGQPVLVDFGLTMPFGGSEGRELLEVEWGSSGTGNYMAPEQIRGEYVDARADLYAMGCMLYELLTGFPPFRADTLKQTVQAHLYQAVTVPSVFRPEIPAALDDLVVRLLEKEPHKRIGYAGSLAALLADLIGIEPDFDQKSRPRTFLYRSWFIGRHTHMANLRDSLVRLGKGQGGFTRILGESGLGKTRLLLEFGQRAAQSGAQVLTGSCFENELHPLGALLKPLQQVEDHCRSRGRVESDRVIGRRGSVLKAYLPSLATLEGQDSNPEPESLTLKDAQVRLFDYLVETFALLATEKPVVLILDDLHWADDLTLGFCKYFILSLENQLIPVLIVCSYRPEEATLQLKESIQDHGPVMTIELTRLDRSEISDLIGAKLGLAEAPPAFCDYLARHSEGNPYFVAEFLRVAVDQGFLFRDLYGTWTMQSATLDRFESEVGQTLIPLPLSMHSLLNSRLADLKGDTMDILQTAAVVGPEFELDLLKRIVSRTDEQLFDALNELENRQILMKTDLGTFCFNHAQLQTLARQSLDPGNTRRLHREAARAIEQLYAHERDKYLADLGRHYEEALEWEKSCTCYLAAAEKARSLYDFRNSVLYFSTVISCLENEECSSKFSHSFDLASLYRNRGELLVQIARYDEALIDLNRAIGLSQDTGFLTKCYVQLAKTMEIQGQVEAARQYYQRALELSRDDPKEQAKTLIELAWFEGEMQSRFCEAEDLCGRARVILVQNWPELDLAIDRITSRFSAYDSLVEITDLLARTSRFLGVFAFSRGDLNRGERLLSEAYRYFQHRQDKRFIAGIANNLANLYILKGNFEKARSYLSSFLDISEEIGNKRGVARASGSLGLVHFNKGEFERALEYHQRDMRISSAIGDRRGLGMALGNIGMVYHNQGEWDRALDFYHRALSICREIGFRQGVSSMLDNLGLLHFSRAELDQALEFYLQEKVLVEQMGDQRGLAVVLDNLGQVYHLKGEFDSARHMLSQSLALLAEIGDQSALADVHFDLAQLFWDRGLIPDTETNLGRARSLFKTLGNDYKIALSDLLQARLEIARAQYDQARILIDHARTIIDCSRNTEESLLLQLVELDLKLARTRETALSQPRHIPDNTLIEIQALIECARHHDLVKIQFEASLVLIKALIDLERTRDFDALREEIQQLATSKGFGVILAHLQDLSRES